MASYHYKNENKEENKQKRNLLIAITLMLIVYISGAVIYHYVEGWSFVDSFYFQTATFTTVGYGDIVPKTDLGKIITIFMSWFGISVGFYLLYTISTYRQKMLDQRVNHLIKYTEKGVKEFSKIRSFLPMKKKKIGL